MSKPKKETGLWLIDDEIREFEEVDEWVEVEDPELAAMPGGYM